jgi:hypothetical protein
MDEHARDQFVALAGDDVSVFWNQKADDPEKVHSRQVCPIPWFFNNLFLFSTGQIAICNGLQWELT